MASLCVRCLIAEPLEEELPELLAPYPLLGSQVEDAAGSALLLRVYLPAGADRAAARLLQVLERAGAGALSCQQLAEEDWLAGYRAAARPFPVGDLWWLDPQPGDPTPAPAGRIRLAVEPRTAFGSGSHESTQLVLLELEALAGVGSAPGSVLDVGTGSGILALAADRLGAPWVVAVDLDQDALWIARQTARQQDWQARPSFVAGSLSILGRCTFAHVLCNMISESFLPLLGDLHRLLDRDGELVLSGMLWEQRDAMRGELAAVGLQVVGERRLGDWLCLRARLQ